MKPILLLSLFAFIHVSATGQSLYFPPVTGQQWETVSPASFGWCEEKIDPLLDYLESQNTKAFILLKDGKIAIEKYFGTFTQDSLWYWASAGKTLTAFMVGIAQQEGYLAISDRTSDYLGKGWTVCPPEKEDLITIRNQLTMTSGLNDGVPDHYCTLDTCLQYLADAGTRWAYHNGPYTLLDQVVEAATGQAFNQYVNSRLRTRIGMNGAFVRVGYNNVFFSNARSMARFGLLILNKGAWGTTPILTDTAYFRAMVNTSQDLNKSYGYLWWLNGKNSYMVPQLRLVFPGFLNADAPADMFAAMGKNGQFVNVVPSRGLVWIRMGDAPDDNEVPFLLNNGIWQKLNDVLCTTTATDEPQNPPSPVRLYPNPAGSFLYLDPVSAGTPFQADIYTPEGKWCGRFSGTGKIDISHLSPGLYLVRIQTEEGMWTEKFIKP